LKIVGGIDKLFGLGIDDPLVMFFKSSLKCEIDKLMIKTSILFKRQKLPIFLLSHTKLGTKLSDKLETSSQSR